MADHAVVPDNRGSGRDAVNDGAILNRCALTNANTAVVATQNRTRPNRAVGTNGDVADDDGLWMHPRVGMNFGNHVAQRVNGHDLERHPTVTAAEEHKCSTFMLHVEIGHCTNDDVVIATIEYRMKIAVDVGKHSVDEWCAVT